MREADFQQQVLDLAGAYGYALTYHTYDSRHSTAGFPDVWLVRERPRLPRLIVAELKIGRNRTTQEQNRWIAALTSCGIEVYVWRPEDFDDIVNILQGPPRPPTRQPSSGAGPLAGSGRDATGALGSARGGDEARRARGGAR